MKKKKQILISLFIFGSSILTINAQWNGTDPIWTGVKVGIGITPQAGLHVALVDNSTGNNIAAILGNAYNHWTYFGGTNAGRIRGSNEGYLCIGSNPAGEGDKRLYLNYESPGDVSIASGGGNVCIGGISSTTNKLEVIGKVKVSDQFVVSGNVQGDLVGVYNQEPNLSGIIDLIFGSYGWTQNQPNNPSLLRLGEPNGFNIGDMQNKLLQKVEELTLYVIEQEKKQSQTEQALEELKKENEQIKQEFSAYRNANK
jgi:hypothetical protein